MENCLTIAGQSFDSRLLIGTGKFSSPEVMIAAIQASGSEIITTALRRSNLSDKNDPFIIHIKPEDYLFMPNTSGARTAEEAIRLARIGKASGVSNWVKLELTPDPHHLLPDPIETLKACEVLVKEDFVVLPYINCDPVLAKRLEEAGAATVMPLAAPIGTNLGIQDTPQLQLIIDNSRVPVIVDAGIGKPSHACEAMELGADAVLVNTAIAISPAPVAMATAFKEAVISGRRAFEAGCAAPAETARASSPLTGFLHA